MKTLLLTCLSVIFFSSYAYAQTSGDFSGGLVIIGSSTDACNGTTEGALRYNSGTTCLEYCNGTSWTCPPSYGGPKYRSHTTATSPGTATLNITKPAGTAENDLLIAFISRDKGGSNMPPPTGWTQLEQGDVGGHRGEAFYKVAGSSEPASYNFSIVDDDEDTVAIMVAISGASTTTPIINNNSNSDNNNLEVVANSIAQSANTFVLVASYHEDSGTYTYPHNHTLIAQVSRANADLAVNYRENINAGSSQKILAEHTGTNNWRAIQIEVSP